MAFGGDLVVRLGMDSKRFDSGLKKSRGRIKSFARYAVGALGAVAGAMGARASIQAFETQRIAIAKLESTLKSTGGAAGRTSAQIQKFAASRQAVTNFGDEVTIAGASILATFKNIRGDAFDKTMVAAQNVSALMGQDLQSSMVQLGKAINDPIAGLSALSRVGITFNEEQKEQIKLLQKSGDLMGAQAIILDELESQFGGAAEAARSPFTALSNTFGDLLEKVGELVAGGSGGMVGWLEGIVQQATAGVQIMIDWKESFADWSSSGIAASEGLFGTIMNGVNWVVSGFKMMFFGLVNFELGFALIAEVAVNVFNTIVARVKWLGGVFADFLQWFPKNWKEVFFTSVDYVTTLYINLGKNIRAIFKEVWDVVASGFTKSFSVELTSLTEGFKSTIQDEFKIREFVGPEAVTDAKKKFTDAFNEWQDMGQEAADNAIVPGGSLAPAAAGTGFEEKTGDVSADQKKKQQTEAISLNSKEGFEKIIMAMSGGGKKDKVEKNTGAMAKTLESIERKMDNGSSLTVVGVPA